VIPHFEFTDHSINFLEFLMFPEAKDSINPPHPGFMFKLFIKNLIIHRMNVPFLTA